MISKIAPELIRVCLISADSALLAVVDSFMCEHFVTNLFWICPEWTCCDVNWMIQWKRFVLGGTQSIASMAVEQTNNIFIHSQFEALLKEYCYHFKKYFSFFWVKCAQVDNTALLLLLIMRFMFQDSHWASRAQFADPILGGENRLMFSETRTFCSLHFLKKRASYLRVVSEARVWPPLVSSGLSLPRLTNAPLRGR